MKISDETVRQAMELIRRNPANYAYFFDQLKEPDWIEPLRAIGRFKHPPSAIRKDNSIAFPPWPEGEYLLRMASLRPETVKNVLLEVPVSDNSRVHEYALEAAVEMPPVVSAEISRKEAKWTETQNVLYMLLPQKIGRLVVHLASGGEVNAALELAQATLRIRAPKVDHVKAKSKSPWRQPSNAVSRLAKWDYDTFLSTCIPALMSKKPAATFQFLCRQLDFGIQTYRSESAGAEEEDFSAIWRPYIEFPNLHDFKESLVTGVRDASLQLAESEAGLESALTELRRHEWRVFRRLEHFVLSRSPIVRLEQVCDVLVRRENFQSRHNDREFYSLLSQWLPKSPVSVQEAVFSILRNGPDLDGYKNRFEAQGMGEPELSKALAIRKRAWQLEWIRDLACPLPADLDEVRRGETGNSPPVVVEGVTRGQPSPLTPSDILAMSSESFTTYLATWRPGTEFGQPTKAGLGDTLRQAVSEDPAKLSEHLRGLIGGEPTYVRSVLDGLSYGISVGKKADISVTLDLCLYAITEVIAEAPGEKDAVDEDPGWDYTADSVARLIANCLAKEESLPLDISHRTAIWRIIELVAQAGNNNADGTADNVESELASTLSRADIRTEVIDAAVRYGLWVRKRLPETPADRSAVPELFDLLNRAVDPNARTTRGIREDLGHWLPQISYLDEAWLGENEQQLFPTEERLLPIFRYTWQSFILTTQPFQAVFKPLRGTYRRAVGLMDSWPEKVRKDINAGLARHLLRLFAWGTEPDDSDILQGFWVAAKNDVLEEGFRDIGFGMYDSKEVLEESIQARLMHLWDLRLEAAAPKPSTHREELGAFGFWFVSDTLPLAWRIKTLLRILHLTKTVHPSHLVVNKLADVCDRDPLASVEVLGLLVSGDNEGYEAFGWGESPKIILASALKAGGESATLARQLIQQLMVRGHHSYRILLDS
jgi:hypothetical protein